MPLYNNVKNFREELKLSQSDFAKKLDVSRQTISSIERGIYQPTIILALKIAKVLNKTVEEVFNYEDE